MDRRNINLTKFNLRGELMAQQANVNDVRANVTAIAEFLGTKYPDFEEKFLQRSNNLRRMLSGYEHDVNESNLEGGKKKTTRKKTTKKTTKK